MAFTFIPNTAPSYIALSTDITSASKINGVSYIGARVYATDSQKIYIVQPDLTLVETQETYSGSITNLPDAYSIKYTDTSGSSHGFINNNGSPQICAQDYLQAMSEGDISGHTPFAKLGYTAAGTTSETDVWGGASSYVFPTTASAMEVVSSSIQDASTGTGVKTIRIYYLKPDYTPATTDVILDGTNPVLTSASNIFRINDVRVIDFGSGTTTYKAIGNIDVRNVADTPIYARILAGQTEDRSSVYTVPHGQILYLVDMAVGVTKTSTVGNTGTFTLRGTYDNRSGSLLTAGLFFMPYAEINHEDGSFLRLFPSPVKFIAHTDIKTSILCGQSSTVCTVAVRGWLE